MSRRRFITLEGGEGVGKSTLLAGLENELGRLGQKIVCTREPGGTAMAERLRGVLLSPQQIGDKSSPVTEALIISAARRDHVENLIEPALSAGNWVICDRFVDSTRAYQGMALSEEDFDALAKIATNSVMPGLTLLLDAPPEELLERRKQRGAQLDRFERRPMSFHNDVRQRFLKIAKSEADRVVVLDALRTPEQLVAEAISHLKKVGLLPEETNTGAVS